MANTPEAIIDQIQAYYRQRATTNRYATSPDLNLREVENESISRRLSHGIRVLDVGCGNGYSTLCHAARWKSQFVGIDFVSEMIMAAREMAREFKVVGSVDFEVGDVSALQISDSSFDAVISQRCLLNLPSRDHQWRAMREVSRVLKPGGLYLMMEGTLNGLRRLNETRQLFGLDAIPEAEGSYNWFSNKFEEDEMLRVGKDLFGALLEIQRFGMYYLISRVIHPLLVLPEQPRYDAPINSIARRICERFPNFEDMGHVALFVFRK